MTCCLELAGVEKAYGATQALAGLTLTASAGTVTAVLGPNGAGKTTMLEVCEGLQRPDTGLVRVLGQDPMAAAAALRPRVGVMVQDGGLPVMARARELLEHVARMYAAPLDVDSLTERLGLAPFARTFVRRLSGGQRQRLALAIAIVGQPELVFLDEPSAGLDPQARLAVWDLIGELRAQGVSVVLTTHLMDEAAHLADHVVIIDHGAVIAEGSVAELTAPGSEATHAPNPRSAVVNGDLNPTLLGELRAWADARGLSVATPTPQRTLEDVFLDLTGRSLR